MSPEDFDIWTLARRIITRRARALFFDVGLGPPRELKSPLSQQFLDGWNRLNQKRADVVIDYGDYVALIELRFHATPAAIGRILMYGLLWHEDPPLPGPVRLAIITNAPDPDVAVLAASNAIYYAAISPQQLSHLSIPPPQDLDSRPRKL